MELSEITLILWHSHILPLWLNPLATQTQLPFKKSTMPPKATCLGAKRFWTQPENSNPSSKWWRMWAKHALSELEEALEIKKSTNSSFYRNWAPELTAQSQAMMEPGSERPSDSEFSGFQVEPQGSQHHTVKTPLLLCRNTRGSKAFHAPV